MLVKILCLFALVRCAFPLSEYEPIFTNAKKDEVGIYVANYGDRVECKFEYDPFRFKQVSPYKSEIVMDYSVAKSIDMNSFLLRVKSAKNESIILAENYLEKETQSLLVSSFYGFKTFVKAKGSIKLHTNKLNRKEIYECCLEYAYKKSEDKLCSYLKFKQPKMAPKTGEQKLPEHRIKLNAREFFTKDNNAKQREQLYKMTRVMENNMSVYSLSKDVLIGCLIVSIVAVIMAITTCKIVEMRRNFLLQRQQQELLDNNSEVDSQLSVSVPRTNAAGDMTASPLYDDLYIRYNLSHSGSNFFDGGEFPPSYEQFDEEEKK